MKFIGFPKALQYSIREENVWVQLRFPAARVPLVVRALLDTGAAVTILNRKYARHLHIEKITGSTDTLDLKLPDGRSVRAYVHRVPVEFLGQPFEVDVAFVPTSDTADVIGMRGFFDRMIVAFDHAHRTTYFAFNER